MATMYLPDLPPEPKPCPFCGSTDLIRDATRTETTSAVGCATCGAHGPAVPGGEAHAIVAWNTRPGAARAATPAARAVGDHAEEDPRAAQARASDLLDYLGSKRRTP